MATTGTAATATNSIQNALKTVPVRDIVPKRKVITVSVSNSIAYAMNMFARYKILACPVLQESDSRIPIGWIDVQLIVQYLMTRVGLPAKDVTHAHLVALSVENIKVADVMLKMQTEPFITVYDSVNVHMLLELFALGSHRVALYAQESKPHEEFAMHEELAYVCSQSDVVAYIASKITADASMELMATSTLARLGFRERPVVSVVDTTTVLEAVWACANQRVSHLAILDKDQRVVGTFSASSLRSLTPEMFMHLTLPLSEYIKEYAAYSLQVHSVDANASLQALVAVFSSTRSHHVYVLADDGAPAYIITLTDVLNAVLQYRISAEEKLDREAHLSALRVPGRLTIKVHSARALPAGMVLGVDPFVIVKLPGGGVLQSEVQPKTDAPVFDFTNVYEVTTDSRHNRVAVEVFDYRRFMPAKFLGVVKFDMDWILSGFGTNAHLTFMREWYPLMGGPQQGEIDIELMYEAHDAE